MQCSYQSPASVFERDGYRCHYCTAKVSSRCTMSHPLKATIDHKHPVSRGGNNHPDNITTCCNQCNGDKGDMLYEAFLWYRSMRDQGYDRDELLVVIAANDPELKSYPNQYHMPGVGRPWVGTIERVAQSTYRSPVRTESEPQPSEQEAVDA